MRYIEVGGYVTPKHCIYGPRQAEGIVLNNYEWWSITDHLVKEQREREMAAVLRAKEEAKKNLSFQMTSTWSNTLASVKTQADQKRLEKIEKLKQERIDQYHQAIEERKARKKEIIDKARKVIFEEKDAPKTISCAVGFSMCLAERKRQLEFKKCLAKREEEKEEEWARKVKKDAEDFLKNDSKRRNEIEKKKLQKKYLDEQVAELKKRRQAEMEAEAEAEKQDAINMKLEGEKIHKCNMAEKEYRKQFTAKYIKKTANQLECERNLQLEEKEENDLIEIYKCYDRKIKKERKRREKQMQDEAVERREKISEKMAQDLAEAKRKYEEMLAAEKAKEEENKREDEDKEAVRKAMEESHTQGKLQAQEKRERQLLEQQEALKWQMIQRIRREEINKAWKNSLTAKNKKAAMELKEYFDRQCKEREEMEAEEKKLLESQLEDTAADKAELEGFIEEALCFVKKEDLPDYPVLKAIWAIRDEYGLENKAKKEWEEKEKQRQNKAMEQLQGNRSKPAECYFCFKD